MVPEGIRYGAAFAAASLLVGGLAGWWFALPLIAVGAFMLYFFRDPERLVPRDPSLAVSPADGRVVEIRDIEHEGQPCRRISVFLSPLDVHVNRAPIGGVVRQVQYSPGRFHVASRPEASIENERNTITLEGPDGTVVFKQIAGVLARRVVFWKRAGEAVARGERVGLMKFGSRTDVLLDLSWEILVRVGDRVRGGSSILARKR